MGNVDRIELQEELKYRQEYLDRLYTKDRRWYWRGKRIFDVVFSVLALTLLSPVYLGISLFIVLSDPHGGPVYKQVRLGRHAKPFTVYNTPSPLRSINSAPWWPTPTICWMS